MIREPMTPEEFDRACRQFEGENETASLTSGIRSPERNRSVGGSDDSKHLLGMARDYALPTEDDCVRAQESALRLGFWTKRYAWGIHLQGLPRGDVPRWWDDKYGGTV